MNTHASSPRDYVKGKHAARTRQRAGTLVAAACAPARPPAADEEACLEQAGGVAEDEMFRTFNMGIGMLVVVGRDSAAAARAADPDALVLGEVVAGRGVQLV